MLVATAVAPSHGKTCDMLKWAGEPDSYTRGSWLLDGACEATVLNGAAAGKSAPDVLRDLGFGETEVTNRNSCFASACTDITCMPPVRVPKAGGVNVSAPVGVQELIKLSSLCWRWHPHGCTLGARVQHARDAAPAVARVGGMCFIGDSLLWQFAVAFQKSDAVKNVRSATAWLLVNPLTLRPITPTEYAACEAAQHTFTPDAMRDGRIGTLRNVTRIEGDACLPQRPATGVNGSGWPVNSNLYRFHQHWTTFLAEQCGDAGVIVLQTGHHWHSEDKKAVMYGPMVDAVLSYIAEHTPATQPIVYVTSVRGHGDCGTFGAPMGTVPAETEVSKRFSWTLPEKKDVQWAAAAAKLPKLARRFFVLNITGPGVLRPDAHRLGECLHYCEPGLATTWVELMDNLLAQVHPLSSAAG